MWTILLTLVNPLGVGHMTMWIMGVNHMAMWTILLTVVNSLGVSHMAMWTMGINHMAMWARLLTLVQVGDWRKYALEAIIKLLFYISLFMIKVYYSCHNCIDWKP